MSTAKDGWISNDKFAMTVNTSNDGSTIRLNPTRVFTVLLGVSLGIVTIGAIAHLVRYQWLADLDSPVGDALRRFDLVEEPSLSQWFSSSIHLLASFSFVAIALTVGRTMFYRWLGLGLLFLCASIDEAVMIHEMMDRPTRELLGTSGFLAIAWIIPGGLLAATIGFGYLGFLRAIDRATSIRFVIAGAVFLSGAILMEIPGGYLYERYGFDSWHYIASYAIEEFLEMLGITLLLDAQWRHLGQFAPMKSIGIQVDAYPQKMTAGTAE